MNPQGCLDQRILSPSRIPVPPLARGGAYGIRTRVLGFADPCLTPRPRRRTHAIVLDYRVHNFIFYSRRCLVTLMIPTTAALIDSTPITPVVLARRICGLYISHAS